MTEPSEPMVLRSVTVAEVMDADGTVSLQLDCEGEPAQWDQLGFLVWGIESVKVDLRRAWADDEAD